MTRVATASEEKSSKSYWGFALWPLAVTSLCLGCGAQAREDAKRLDGILATQKIDRIVVTSLYKTNVLTGQEAQTFVESLNRTNRVPSQFYAKDQVAGWFVLMNGTNEVAGIQSFENGVWDFGDLSFRIKPPSSPK